MSELYEVLQKGKDLIESLVSHVSHGGPTQEEAEKWLASAKKALEEPDVPSVQNDTAREVAARLAEARYQFETQEQLPLNRRHLWKTNRIKNLKRELIAARSLEPQQESLILAKKFIEDVEFIHAAHIEGGLDKACKLVFETRETAILELASQHCPTIKTDPHEAWLVCSCGWQSGTGKTWAEQWGNHIKELGKK
jgi:hypothetical protein